MPTPLRYSPRPIADYVKVVGTLRTGPVASAFLKDDLPAWNLAFLSHPYEDDAQPKDPYFTVHVRRTLQTVVSTGELDPGAPVSDRIEHFMAMPAPQAVRCITQMKLLRGLPLYRAYGDAWVATLDERSWKVRCPGDDPEEMITDVAHAAALLGSIFRG